MSIIHLGRKIMIEKKVFKENGCRLQEHKSRIINVTFIIIAPSIVIDTTKTAIFLSAVS